MSKLSDNFLVRVVTDLAERNRLDEIEHRLKFRQAEGVSSVDGEFLIEVMGRVASRGVYYYDAIPPGVFLS